jgi:hypothetical protein
LSFLPACGDFDIEKMRPGWRDEMYQSWWACKAIEAQITVRASANSCSWFGLVGEDCSPPSRPVGSGESFILENYGDISMGGTSTAVA